MAGAAGAVDYFVTGDFLHNDRGIENPTASFDALHDTTNQLHGLAYRVGHHRSRTRGSA